MGVLIWLVFLHHLHHLHQNHPDQGHHHEKTMMMNNNILLLFCASVFVLGGHLASTRPQTQLKWNWEEVILSRNGPSTTTTPRPTRWTTTLRFLDIAPVVKAGSVGTVEDAYLVPRPGPRKKPQIAELNSAASQNIGKISLALMLVPMLIMNI